MIALIALLLVAAAPDRAQLEALIAQGRLDEAEEGYRDWAAADPTSADAQLGLCRILRWTGRLLESRQAAARAVALAPDRADAREELARTYAAEGLAEEAGGALAAAPPEDLRAQIDGLRRASVVFSSTASDDSNGVSRIGPRLAVQLTLPRDVRLVVGTGMSYVVHDGAALDHRLAGFSLELPFEHAALFAAYVLHEGAGTTAHEGEAAIKVRPADKLAFALSVRHRPFIETADSLATDENAFYGAGAAGAFQPDQVQWLSVDEAKLTVQLTPLRSMFVYGEGRAFANGDSNRAWSAAIGTGLDVVRLAGLRWPVEAYLRWDTYMTGFAQQRATYYSPSFQDGQSPGLDLRLHFGDSFMLGAEGGRTFALFSASQAGWFGGGQAALRFGRVSVALHAQVRDDPWYGSRRAWLSIRTAL